MRLPTPDPPAEVSSIDGLAYALFLPEDEPEGGLVVLHGAGSVKENHFDMARAARAAGLAAVCFDMRGHGDSDSPMDGRVISDVATIASLLPRPLAVRGSSMGGWLAIASAQSVDAAAVVAICPASSQMLMRGLRTGAFEFEADVPAMQGVLESLDLHAVVAGSATPLMLLHAEGDERVPYRHSVELHAACAAELKKLIVLPGGHHRSVQHDAEMQGEALRFIRKAFRAAARRRP